MVVCSIRYEDAEGSVFDSRFCRLEGQKKAAMMASGPRCWVLCLVFVGGGVGVFNNRDMLSFKFALVTLVARARVCLTAFAWVYCEATFRLTGRKCTFFLLR